MKSSCPVNEFVLILALSAGVAQVKTNIGDVASMVKFHHELRHHVLPAVSKADTLR